MRRLLLLLVTVAAMMAVAGPASATIHPLANSECANASASGVATSQDPPGLTSGGPDNSQGSPPNNPTGTTLAQPLFAVSGGQPFTSERPSPAFKTFGTTLEDLDAHYCPAPQK